jgi:hypothetical protein
MLKLVSSNLPSVAALPFQLAPALSIWKGTPKPAPPCFIFSKLPPGVIPGQQSTGLDYPDYSGYLFELTPGFSISSITSVSSGSFTFNSVTSPLKALPVNYWTYNDTVYLYADRSLVGTSSSVVVNAIAQALIPSVASNTWTLNGSTWNTFTASLVSVAGINFKPAAAPLSPLPGEFTQSSGVITLYGDGSVSIPPLSTAYVTLSTTFSSPVVPVLSVASFDLSSLGVSYVDGADYLGVAFAPTPNAYAPDLNQFFWQQPYLTLFMDVLQLSPAKQSLSGGFSPPGGRVLTKSISSLTYTPGSKTWG